MCRLGSKKKRYNKYYTFSFFGRTYYSFSECLLFPILLGVVLKNVTYTQKKKSVVLRTEISPAKNIRIIM